MDWIKQFYTQQEAWLGEADVFDYDRERAATVERLSRPGSKRILELGAGSGGTAVAMAELGNAVVAVELIAARAANARRLASRSGVGSLDVVEADFYAYAPAQPFDVICYWDGFGVGSDHDQRQLLTRIAGWLAPGGCALIEVYQPTGQILGAGQEHAYGDSVKRFYDYDPLHSRFIDRWWHVDAPENVHTQALRCYTPADLRLLLEGTGLRLDSVEVNGAAIDLAAPEMTLQTPLGREWAFLSRLTL